MNRQQIPPAVELSVNIVSAEPALDGDRHIQADVPVSRVEVHVCGTILRQLERDAAVSSMQVPTSCHGRTGKRAALDKTAPCAGVQCIKPSCGTKAHIARIRS